MEREEIILKLENVDLRDFALCFDCSFHESFEMIRIMVDALKREQMALKLKPIVGNIDGWNDVVNKISELTKTEEGDEK